MSGRPDIVAAARGWLGTPYRHQASCRGAGADCLGLVRGVWREVLGAEPERLPGYTWDWSEARGIEELWNGAARHLTACTPDLMKPGDVVLFRMRDGMVAKHLGILSADRPVPRFVHAYARHGVVESTLSLPWQRRIVAAFAFPMEV